MVILLYCLALPDATPLKLISGVCDAEVRSVDIVRVRAYLADISDPHSCFGNPESLKRALLQFNQVLREILLSTTPLPFDFPFLMATEEAAEQFIREKEVAYCDALTRVAGNIQYDIVAVWEQDQKTDTATPISGAEYLRRRQVEMARVEALEDKLKRVSGNLVREWRRCQQGKSHRWSVLVERNQRETFLDALRNAGPSEGVRLRLSGPWPPREFLQLQSDGG